MTFAHVQQRDGRWCIVDLVGKHSRVRTVPMPTWVKVAIDAWTSAAGLADGRVFRPVNRGDKVQGEAMSEKVVWQMLRELCDRCRCPRHRASRLSPVVRQAVSGSRAGSLSRSNCYWGMPQFKRPSGILEPRKTLFTRRNDAIKLRVAV